MATPLGAVATSAIAATTATNSALYHRGNWSPPTARRLLRLDHTAIFLLIAGTYTPIALVAMHGAEQVVTLTAVWVVAAAGILFEWMPIPAPRGYVTTVYMFLGWIGAFAFVPLYDTTGWPGVLLIAGGGLCYTIGAIVHAARRRSRTRGRSRDTRRSPARDPDAAPRARSRRWCSRGLPPR